MWREVPCDTIKHCFEKCGFSTDDFVDPPQDSDEECKMLFNEIPANCSIYGYLYADSILATSEEVDASKIDLRETLRQEFLR